MYQLAVLTLKALRPKARVVVVRGKLHPQNEY